MDCRHVTSCVSTVNDNHICMKKKLIDASLLAAPLLVVAVLLLLFESHLLWKLQELNLFLYTPLFLKQQMVVSGGLLTYFGTYFTQFLFHPWLGVLLLCTWWGVLIWLLLHTFRIPRQWYLLALIPVALLLIANVEMGYWIYVLKLRGFFFSATIGTTLVVGLLALYRHIGHRFLLRALLVALTVIIGYPLLGFYALAAALLMALWSWRLESDSRHRWMVTIVAVLLVVAVPLLYYRFYFYQTNLHGIYWTALPVFTFIEDYPLYYTPYVLLALYLVLMVLFSHRLTSSMKSGRIRLLQGVLTVIMVVGVWLSWYNDENYHHELAMQHAVERLDWGAVLKEAESQQDEPTRSIVMMRNLALARIGKQGELMYHFKGGSKRPNSPFPIYSSQIVGRLIYYQYGLLNECHHMCMEEGVEYGWRTEHLQYMARCALLCGERKASRKFLNILGQTRFYGQWVEHFEPLLTHPEKIPETAEMGPITHMMHYTNGLGSDNGFTEKYLMGLLSNLDADDPIFQEQALLATMATRNPEAFWPRFLHYAQLHPHDQIPRLYQEAAYLFARLENRRNINKLPFRADVRQGYEAFMQAYRRCDGMTIAKAMEILYPQFGHTYYYDYYLMKDLPLY